MTQQARRLTRFTSRSTGISPCFAAAQGSAIVARLSIIIPASRDTQALEDTLISVLTHRSGDCEIIVPHAGTYDDPYGVTDEIELLDGDPKNNGSALIAKGIEASHSEFIHLLHPGCEVDPNWINAALELFTDKDVASVSPVLTCRSDETASVIGVSPGILGRREIHCRRDEISEKNAANVIGPTSCGAFYRRTSLDSIGGWPAALGLPLADLDVALSLRESGFATTIAPDCKVTWNGTSPVDAGTFGFAMAQERLFQRHCDSPAARTLRPVTAFLQCLRAGYPWSMGLALMGKFAAQFGKSTPVHPMRLASEHQGRDSVGEMTTKKVENSYQRAA